MVEEPNSQYFMSQRLRLHYVEWGEPESPVLLLVHGGRDHCRSWDWTARVLSRTWRVIAVDLRGHGDSGWSPDGCYSQLDYLYDFAQLARLFPQPLTVVAHSLGGGIALRYAGLYPDRVRRLVSVEGLGLQPATLAAREAKGVHQRTREWIQQKHDLAQRGHRRYADIDSAMQRMREANQHLNLDQARHLTIHGLLRNEDGTFSWKYDNYTRPFSPIDLSRDEVSELWAAITCPVLLCYGRNSFTSDPAADGRAVHFQNARVKAFDNAGHWLHHDQFDAFIAELEAFI